MTICACCALRHPDTVVPADHQLSQSAKGGEQAAEAQHTWAARRRPAGPRATQDAPHAGDRVPRGQPVDYCARRGGSCVNHAGCPQRRRRSPRTGTAIILTISCTPSAPAVALSKNQKAKGSFKAPKYTVDSEGTCKCHRGDAIDGGGLVDIRAAAERRLAAA
ncbi:hypothetical protein DFH11DRAFT_1620981, partial [Phellopilus nigrolimitatus]